MAKITNKNIKQFVKWYITDKKKLPKYLANKPISKWDVSNVTNLSKLFNNITTFNEPLDDWDVKNVTDMSYMFFGCNTFNQSLNKWDVRNVTDMSYMFYGCYEFNQPFHNWTINNTTNVSNMFMYCRNFNQPLNHWIIRNDTDLNEMFQDSGISEQNKPQIRRRVIVDAKQIHKASAKINYEKFNSFLQDKIPAKKESIIDYPTFINETMLSFIDKDNKNSKVGLQKIMNQRLNHLNYSEQSSLILQSIVNTLEYVKLQPHDFTKIYVETFIQECVTAYEGVEGMTCSTGALERIIMSLIAPCTILLSTNPDYQKLVDIIVANPAKLIPEYIHDWYKLHNKNKEGQFSPGTTIESKRENLKQFLLNKFPDEIELIEEQMSIIADNLGYEDDVFEYEGGKKRKTRRRRKNNKYKLSRKLHR